VLGSAQPALIRGQLAAERDLGPVVIGLLERDLVARCVSE
jgi:hypothetical protein